MRIREQEVLEQFKNYINNILEFKDMKFIIEPGNSSDWQKPNGFPNFQPDFFAELEFANLRARLVGEIFENQSSSVFEDKISILKSFVQSQDYVPLVLARYLSAARRQMCKEANIFFFDLSGNAYLKYKSIFIEREGFSNRFPEKRGERNPFADKASIILREALKHIDKEWRVSELAEACKLDKGFISRMLKELEERKYAVRSDSRIKLHNISSILADWVNAYDYKRNDFHRFFCLAKSPDEILHKIGVIKNLNNVQYALALQAGANLIAPHARYNEVHIYIRQKSDMDVFKSALSLREVEEGANIIFMMPYYKHSVFFDKQKVKDLWVASDVQLYLDLYNYPLRGREQAEHLYDKRIKLLIEKSSDG